MDVTTERPAFQFRMRDLVWAVGLAAVALGMGVTCRRFVLLRSDAWRLFGTFFFFGLLAISCIGAGVCLGGGAGCLLRKPKEGAICGFFAALAALPFVIDRALEWAR
jgi:hypothetical protein